MPPIYLTLSFAHDVRSYKFVYLWQHIIHNSFTSQDWYFAVQEVSARCHAVDGPPPKLVPRNIYGSRDWSPLASFPGPIYERRGPGTHCLRMCRISMVTPRKMWGTVPIRYRTCYHGDPAHAQAVCTRPSLLVVSYIEGLGTRLGPSLPCMIRSPETLVFRRDMISQQFISVFSTAGHNLRARIGQVCLLPDPR